MSCVSFGILGVDQHGDARYSNAAYMNINTNILSTSCCYSNNALVLSRGSLCQQIDEGPAVLLEKSQLYKPGIRCRGA